MARAQSQRAWWWSWTVCCQERRRRRGLDRVDEDARRRACGRPSPAQRISFPGCQRCSSRFYNFVLSLGDSRPFVPMTMRHRITGSLPLMATGETLTWSCFARQPEIPFPPVGLKPRKTLGRRWFQRQRRRRPNLWTGRAVDGHSRRPTRFGSRPRPTAPGLAAAAPSFDVRGSIRRR